MKLVTVVGARPQFIKAAMVSHVLRREHQEVLVHTGQHFDYNMSQAFFDELDIPQPDYNLGISGGTHAEMTGRMLMAVEKVLIAERPDWLLVYGDTNSTLAAALAGAKLHIPIAHVEAGARTHCMTNPEEINRVCTDHVSTLLLTSTEHALDELAHEGLDARSHFVGNTMYDAFVSYSQRLQPADITLHLLGGGEASVPSHYYYMTCHREENTADDAPLAAILEAMNSLDAPTIYPVHPRNQARAQRLAAAHGYDQILFAEPVGYLESACLVRHAEKIVTDSGGLQTEAFFAKKKCVTVLDFVCWPETMVDGRNTLAPPDKTEIRTKLCLPQYIDPAYQPFGDGHAAEKVVRAMENTL
ncbi:MAG: UDP-N-acetylglucosamine 2-epimerase (non-hydrolyzing) [Selenomonadaceae bacterium]|nr:UDP-N-acetylglucosamine 2-epimerase (non-hydrolyzing) [Selenomonadaceae bacterium]